MKVTLVQTQLYWEDRDKNLAHFDKLLDGLKGKTSLIVLPEMFTTGFSMDPEKVAEEANGPGLHWMQKKAAEIRAVVTGSIAVKEKGNYFNRLYWVQPDGSYSVYDKRHLFRMAGEDQHYSAGNKKLILHLDGFKICPLICYDLRFPVWSRNRFKKTSATTCESEYDLLLYIANWPEKRNSPWKQLLPARAIENQCYVVAVNRVGKDGNGFEHSGDSVVIGPKGELLYGIPANESKVLTVELDLFVLQEFRKVFPVGLDVDTFTI